MLRERHGVAVHWKCLVATIAIIASAVLTIVGSASEDGTTSVMFVVGIALLVISVIFYLIELFTCSTGSYVHNVLSTESAVDYVNRLKRTQPVVGYHMCCYHMEVRTRTITESDGQGGTRTRTETYTEKVTTWNGSENFHFDTWKDTSGSVSGLKDYDMAKLRLSKEKEFMDSYTRESFAANRARFVEANCHRDVSFDIEDTLDIDGFRNSVLALRDINNRPWWLRPAVFYIASLLLLTWPYRMLLNSRVASTEFGIVKSISAEPPKGGTAPARATAMLVVDVR
ncbi:unnamed protein product [Ostreobium quekettii]|uniref:Uncharacterized protein n=1 Tax=Ostreobium quekettii TaxID=121088 RepID=A0A8S1ISL5_9CHLO|nr:unnamed protein product [Ostreobium quekettii]